MPDTRIQMGIRRNSSTPSFCNQGMRRNSSTSSFCSHGISRNGSQSSLPSVEISIDDLNSSVGMIELSDDDDGIQFAAKPTNRRRRTLSHQDSGEIDSGRIRKLSEASMSSKKESSSTGSSSPCDIDQHWITPSNLAEILSAYPYSRTSLITLYDDHNMDTKSIRAVVSCHRRIFEISGNIVDLRPQISLCFDHISPEGCQDEASCEGLHICHKYLANSCESEDCSLGHKGDTNHNSRVLKEFCLQKIPKEPLRELIQYAITYPRPEALDVCEKYNESNCKNKNCKKLHICIDYLAGLANCSRYQCQRNHRFIEPTVEKLLEKHGVSSRESPKDIVKALLSNNPQLTKISNHISGTDSSISFTVWSTESIGDVEVAEICFNSVEGICPFEQSGCKLLHCILYYHWQIRESKGNWLNLPKHLVVYLETAYCDPDIDIVTLPYLNVRDIESSSLEATSILGHSLWQAKFQIEENYDEFTLISGSDVLELRRLRTEDFEGKKVTGRDYAYYYENDDGRYIKFGQKDFLGGEDMSEVTCDSIENAFQRITDRSKNFSINFTVGKFTYQLQLDNNLMTLENEVTRVKRNVRRRPDPLHLEG